MTGQGIARGHVPVTATFQPAGARATPRFAPTRAIPVALAAAVAALAFALQFAMFSARPLAAQEAGNLPETSAPAPLHRVNPHKRLNTSQLVATPPQARPEPPAAQSQPEAPAPVPETPQWPVNEQPQEPAVTWDSHGLSIQARNSSLEQILKDVSTATGSTVEGISGDERVFGAYGPGQPRDVLSQLLLGAGYNVIMIGDQGGGAPRQILLTARHSAQDQATTNRNAAASNDDDSSDNEVEDQPVQQVPMHPGFPGGPPRTPQQMLQERQERMQQMLQQRQNNGTPPPNPQNPQN